MSKTKRAVATEVAIMLEYKSNLEKEIKDLSHQVYEKKKKIKDIQVRVKELTADPEVMELTEENAKVLEEWA